MFLFTTCPILKFFIGDFGKTNILAEKKPLILLSIRFRLLVVSLCESEIPVEFLPLRNCAISINLATLYFPPLYSNPIKTNRLEFQFFKRLKKAKKEKVE